MPLTFVFEVPGMTRQQYDKVIKDLKAKGHGTPKGRLYHVASQASDGWHVVDVWESQESFGRFAEILVPTLAAAGVTPPQPKVLTTHNIIKG